MPLATRATAIQHYYYFYQAATGIAFAALGDGSLVTWGDATDDGDCIAMQGQLKNNMQQIQASLAAFAAILCDGSKVTWGDAARGGDSRAVQDEQICG